MSDTAANPKATSGGRIVAMLLLFTVAIGFDVVAIAGLAAVGGWWMLALAFSVHLIASAVVMLEVADVIAGRLRWHRSAGRPGTP